MSNLNTIVISGVVSISVTLITFFITSGIIGRKQRKKLIYNEKMEIFKTLMSTRAFIMNTHKVEAINLIDVIYKDHLEVIQAKAAYLKAIDIPLSVPKIEQAARFESSKDDYISLLQKMCTVLKLNNRIDWRNIKTYYNPNWISDYELGINAQNKFWQNEINLQQSNRPDWKTNE